MTERPLNQVQPDADEDALYVEAMEELVVFCHPFAKLGGWSINSENGLTRADGCRIDFLAAGETGNLMTLRARRMNDRLKVLGIRLIIRLPVRCER